MEGVSDKKKFGTCPHTKVLLTDVKNKAKSYNLLSWRILNSNLDFELSKDPWNIT